ncbi:hypothetical protein [Streptomyces sp. NRRL S-646]|uniref:hypothetical protein n=1 Tax=Streptomyces sp. NRRL S-646 TaxID=1463917 RepID=UPI0013317C17|nr:hypothetical protein [Streptomyces sp. NRRL S-646]
MRSSHTALRSRDLLLVAAVLAGVTLTACGSGEGSEAADGTPAAAASKSAVASRPVHDPPAKFATKGALMPDGLTEDMFDGVFIRPPSVTLHGSTAYVGAFDHVQAVDTANGHVTATIEPEGKAMAESAGVSHKAGAPAVITVGGTPALVTPFLIEQSGTGTQADHMAVEIAVSDPDTAKVRSRLTLRLPEWADDPDSGLTATAVGADGNIAVVTVSDKNFYAVTYGVDLTARRQVWVHDDFRTTGVASGTAVGFSAGTTELHAAGYEVATGKRRWQGEHMVENTPKLSTAGPNYVLLQGQGYDSATNYLHLLDATTGKTKQRLPAGLAKGTCVYDEKSTLVCHGTGDDTDVPVAFGLDATTGKTLWQLPDKQADRVAPEVTTAWHGRVYGTAEDAPVALDARTGKDLPTSPGIAPVLVNGSAGLALEKVDGWKDELFVYPATS